MAWDGCPINFFLNLGWNGFGSNFTEGWKWGWKSAPWRPLIHHTPQAQPYISIKCTSKGRLISLKGDVPWGRTLLTRIHLIFRVLLCHETSGARGETRDVTVILQETIEDLKSVIVTETNSASKETVDKVVTRLRHVRSGWPFLPDDLRWPWPVLCSSWMLKTVWDGHREPTYQISIDSYNGAERNRNLYTNSLRAYTVSQCVAVLRLRFF